jgi:hypothetical protein
VHVRRQCHEIGYRRTTFPLSLGPCCLRIRPIEAAHIPGKGDNASGTDAVPIVRIGHAVIMVVTTAIALFLVIITAVVLFIAGV